MNYLGNVFSLTVGIWRNFRWNLSRKYQKESKKGLKKKIPVKIPGGNTRGTNGRMSNKIQDISGGIFRHIFC